MGEDLNKPPSTPPKGESRNNNSRLIAASSEPTSTAIVPNPFRPHGVRRRRVDPHRDRRSTVARSDASSFGGGGSGAHSSSSTRSSSSSNAVLLAVIRDLQSLGSGGQAINEHVIRYIYALRLKNLQLQPMGGDGNCLFRSVAHQVYGTESLHHLCRKAAADYMEAEADFFADFVSENGNEGSHGASGVGGFSMYLSDIRKDGVWGDDPEVQALCEIYNRPAEIWAYDPVVGAKMLRVFHSAGTTSATAAAAGMSATSGDGSADAMMTLSDALTMPSGGGLNGGSNASTSSIIRSPSTSANSAINANSGRGEDSSRIVNAAFRPPIRLSYFAGGHYDSLRISDDVAWKSQLLAPETAGAREEQAIRAARSRAASRFASTSSSSFPSSSLHPDQQMVNSALSVSDMEATENSTMQAALAASRAQWEEGQDEGLDAALLESYLQSSSFSSTDPRITSSSSSSSAILTTTNDDESRDLARALLTSQADMDGTLEKEIESAKKESLLLSAAAAKSDTSQLWKLTSQLTEDEQMHCLLSGISVEQFLSTRDQNSRLAGGGGGINSSSSASEDADLAMALLLSSQQH